MRHGVLRLFDGLRGSLYVLPPFLLLWYALTGGRGWAFGIFAVATAVAVAVPRASPRLQASPAGVLRLAAHFLHRSLEGGIDVAWRALHPGLPLVRRDEWRQLALPPGPGRTLFIAAACLLPGTLVCQDDGERVLIHSIGSASQDKLEALEGRVAAAFGAASP